MNTWLLVGGILAGTAIFASAIVFAVIWLLRWIQNAPGGLGPLADRYPTDRQMPDKVLNRQTVKIGMVSYKRCASLGIGAHGLHLQVWRRSAFIPWSEIRSVGRTRFQLQDWPTLVVGEPLVAEIVLSPEAFLPIRSKLERVRNG